MTKELAELIADAKLALETLEFATDGSMPSASFRRAAAEWLSTTGNRMVELVKKEDAK